MPSSPRPGRRLARPCTLSLTLAALRVARQVAESERGWVEVAYLDWTPRLPRLSRLVKSVSLVLLLSLILFLFFFGVNWCSPLPSPSVQTVSIVFTRLRSFVHFGDLL